MKAKVNLAILAIRISTVIYILIGLFFMVLAFVVPPDTEGLSRWMGFLMAGFCLPLIVFLEVLIAYLRKRKLWAWVAGLIVGALYAPSLFLRRFRE